MPPDATGTSEARTAAAALRGDGYSGPAWSTASATRWKRCFPADDRGNLACLRVFRDVRFGVYGDDEDARRRVAVVSDLVTAFRPAQERDDIALRQLVIPVVHAYGGSSRRATSSSSEPSWKW
jgi:hypothetical protein